MFTHGVTRGERFLDDIMRYESEGYPASSWVQNGAIIAVKITDTQGHVMAYLPKNGRNLHHTVFKLFDNG